MCFQRFGAIFGFLVMFDVPVVKYVVFEAFIRHLVRILIINFTRLLVRVLSFHSSYFSFSGPFDLFWLGFCPPVFFVWPLVLGVNFGLPGFYWSQ